MSQLLTHLGYIPGPTSAQGAGTPAVPGWTAAYQATGPGAPGGTGAQYATTIKYFPSVAEGYPSFPASWPSLTNLVAIVAASTLPMVPILCWGSAPTLGIPSQQQIQTFLGTLPAGQACWFSYASEPESGSDLSGSAYVQNVHLFSVALNGALAALRASTGSGFWNRQNFGYVHSGLLGPYSSPQSSAGGSPVTNTAYIPAAGDCDSYGMDLYRKGSSTLPASQDARVQGFVASVRAKLGTTANTSTSFPEYGIAGNLFADAQAAQFMQQDLAYFTGSSRPFGQGVAHWVYWYKVGNSGEAYPFSGAGRSSEIAAWQAIQTFAASGQGQNVITVTNPGLQTSTIGVAVSVQIAAADSNPALPLHYALGNTLLPPGLAINANTGLITGVPQTAGTFNVTVTVTDGTGASGAASFAWQVNQPTVETVTMINPGPQTSTKGIAIAPLNIQASDSLGLALTYSQTGLPAGLSLNTLNGQITGTPSTISAPTVDVTAASATPVSASQSFTWNIVASVVTVASPGPQTNATNDVVSLQITATDTAGLPVTFSASGLPAGLSISASGLITGTCTAGGTFNPVITGTDSAGSTGNVTVPWSVAAIVVTVAAPTGGVINNTFDAVSLQMVGRDSADQVLTWSASGTLPPGLAIGSATGLITGQPTTAGVYQVTITATDVSLVSGSATFIWTVNQAATVLVVSIAPAAGTDIYGNTYPAGVTVGKAGGTQTTIGLDGTLRYNAPVFTMPAMTAGWTAGGHATYALDVLGNLVVSFKDLLPGTDTDGTVIWPPGSLPPGFRPANSRRIVAYTDVLRVSGAAFESAALNFLPDGSIQVFGVALAATRLDLFHVIPLTF